MIRIGAAQSPVSPDPRANGAAIRELVRAAQARGARLVHFPEGALGGYPFGAAEKRRLAGWNIDWTVVDEELERIAELAAALRIWVVLGCNHRNPHPLLPHNSLYVISDEGALVGRYDKRIVSHTEYTSFYTPGAAPLVVEIDGFRFGCVLCIEINFPELFLDYRARGLAEQRGGARRRDRAARVPAGELCGRRGARGRVRGPRPRRPGPGRGPHEGASVAGSGAAAVSLPVAVAQVRVDQLVEPVAEVPQLRGVR